MFLENIDLFNELNAFSVVLRILLSVILGGMLGLEREKKQRPAGFRTYVIVCLGSTLACITNSYMLQTLGTGDPARIPAQVISGIGFLGAGTIIVTRNNHIKGLTTAAGLWCCATIGIAVGSGFYFGAIIADLALILTLKCLTLVDKHFIRYNKYIFIYAECVQHEFVKELMRYTRKNHYQLFDLEIYPATNDSPCYTIFTIKAPKPELRNQILADISTLNGASLVEEMNN